MEAFRVLGLERTASIDEIKSAYRSLAKTCHPDLHPGREARFIEITAAYERALSAGPAPQPQTADPVPPMRPTPPPTPARSRAPDAFADFQRTHAHGAPGPWREVIEVSLSDIFKGTMVSVRHGTGSVLVDVPAGTPNNHVIVQRGVIPASIGQMRRDLHVIVRYASNPTFTPQGADLLMTLAVGVNMSQKGGERTLAGPEGQPVWVKIPPNSHNGAVLRVPHRGLPVVGGRRGDLVITLQIHLM